MDLKTRGNHYAKVGDDFQQFLINESQLRIATQVKIFMSADARALGLLAVTTTLSAAGIAIVATTFMDSGSGLNVLFYAAVGFSIAVAMAAFSAVAALWPTLIYTPGWNPEQFEKDIDQKRKLDAVRPEIIAALENRLFDNNTTMKRHGFLTQISIVFLGVSPISSTASALFYLEYVMWGIIAVVIALAPLIAAVSIFSFSKRD